MQAINDVEQNYLKKNVPTFNVGDTLEVETIIREGEKQRIQKFKGLVIAIKGSGIAKMVTLRKISYGIGVEKKLPIHSTNVGKITVLKTGDVRRSKLYYLRDRVGKLALKVKPGQPMPVIENEEEVMTEADVELAPVVTEQPAVEQVEVVAEETTEESAA